MKQYLPSLLVLSILLSSCSSIYIPSVPNTPMLTTKGEVAAGAHMSLKGNFNFNSAYAVSNHFAVLANGGFMQNDRTKKYIKHKMIEIGGGYFNTFGPDNNRILEIYAGIGSGKSDRLFREYDDNQALISLDHQKADYDNKFIQVNYSSKKRSNLRLFGANFGLNYGTALRMSFVNTNNFYKNGLLQANEDNIFLEPVFFTRMILSDQVQLQYTSGSNFGLKSRKFLNAGNSVFSIGAVVNLGRAPKKQ
ncbi:hypothetical protein FA048_08520 [Pedobacter polaris]|uniref:Outer membrane protein beta-barrel domain-containing protein n=1 Tax=Pedobacter polaris TaxID=2571273 RepID=A0A4U1CT45_9SPHI|nr:hypothetical protein [Pedobacter polaris]TKC10230.1 hypothetical protein FA048_08520 [Pedobacter polaris]